MTWLVALTAANATVTLLGIGSFWPPAPAAAASGDSSSAPHGRPDDHALVTDPCSSVRYRETISESNHKDTV